MLPSLPGLPERVTQHLYRTLPPGHATDLQFDQVRAVVEDLIASSRNDLLFVPIEDEWGLAAVALCKERTSPLTGEREGYLYCLVPCRSNPAIDDSLVKCLDELVQTRDWAGLQISVFSEDVRVLETLLHRTNLDLGWIITRKKLDRGIAPGGDSTPIRPVRHEDMDFVCATWRDAYLAGLQDEMSWQTPDAAIKAADVELARLLGSEHCVLHVIESGDALIGFIAAEIGKPQELTGRPECYLYDYYVIPEHRGQGHSQVMTDCLEGLALEQGCEYMTGTVTGPSVERMNAIVARIGQVGWVPYQRVYRCRAPLLQ